MFVKRLCDEERIISKLVLMTTNERFVDWLKRKMDGRGLSQTDLALEVDISPSVVSRWLRGTQKPNVASTRILADYFGEARDDLLTIVFAERMAERHSTPTDQPRPIGEKVREAFADILAAQPVAIPIHDQLASAGFGQSILEYAYWEAPRVAGRNIVGLRVRGDSMEPDIRDGDTIFIDRDMPAEPGKTVVATVSDEVLVKKLRRRAGKLVLVGKTGEVDADEAKIEGVVIGLYREGV